MTLRLQPQKINFIFLQLITLLVIMILTGCTSIRIIADYDEQTDISITAFQKKMETFLISLERNAERNEAKYENNKLYYDEFRIDLSAIRVRAAAIPRNEITIKQIDLLVENVSNLEKLHKLGITVDDIAPLRTAFNASCTAILKLELAKKRGESPTKK